MATNFPNSVDSLTNPTTSDTLASVSHSGQHADANDAIEAIETALLDGAPLHIDDANQRVGIGTTSPAAQLEISNTGAGQLYATGDGFYVDQSQSQLDSLFLRSQGAIDISSNFDGGTSNDYVRVLTGAGVERVRVSATGNVGIGDTTPSYKLDVNGDARVTGSFYLTGLASTPVGEYQSYTPTLSSGSATVGNGTATGKYCRIGDMIHAHVLIVFGSTTYFNPRYTRFSVPVTGIAGETSMAISHAALFDAVNGYFYLARVDLYDSGTKFRISGLRTMTASADSGITSGYYADLSNDVTLGSGSYIRFHVVYQAA